MYYAHRLMRTLFFMITLYYILALSLSRLSHRYFYFRCGSCCFCCFCCCCCRRTYFAHSNCYCAAHTHTHTASPAHNQIKTQVNRFILWFYRIDSCLYHFKAKCDALRIQQIQFCYYYDSQLRFV